MRTQSLQPPDCFSDYADWSRPANPDATYSSSSGKIIGQRRLIEKLVADQVLPRLLLANPPAPQPKAKPKLNGTVLVDAIAPFAELVVQRDSSAAFSYFEHMRAQGISLEGLFQDLLAPVARRLGELWDRDLKDFVDVTVGVGHLQEIVSFYSADFVKEGRRPSTRMRALLMSVPGEQHTLGIAIVREQFRRDGWHVWGGPPRSIDDILELLEGRWFEVIGLSVTAGLDPGTLASNIRLIRGASLNKKLIVTAGGLAFADQPRLVNAIGADSMAVEGQSATRQLARLSLQKRSELSAVPKLLAPNRH